MNKSQITSCLAAFARPLIALLPLVLLAMSSMPVRVNAQRTRKQVCVRPKRLVPDTTVHEVCELMPCFKGGDAALINYLKKNTRYPISAVRAKEQGRVLVSFIVEKDGSLTHVKVVRKVAAALDAEALRVMKLMPKWVPGQDYGQFVRVRYVVPVFFRLN